MTKELEKKIVNHYFENPENNSMKSMVEIFKIPEQRISKIISNELSERLENSKHRKWFDL